MGQANSNAIQSDLRDAQRDLARQLNFTRSITESLAEGLYAVDAEGRATFLNPAAERMLGWKAHELLGKDVHEVIHFQHADRSKFPREQCPLLQVIRTGLTVRVEDDIFTTRGGALLPVSYTSSPVLEEGRIAGAVVAFHDISERKNATEALRRHSEELERRVRERTSELRAANERLELSNRELQDFASVASHDLQEPLRKIQAFGDRLITKAGPALGPDGRDYLDRMKNAAGRMQSLINDLLSFSRVTTKGRPFAPVDLAQIARDVVIDLEVAVARDGGEVALGSLPSIEADPVQMRQLFQNLLSNALKFRKPDVPPHVIVSSRIAGPQTEAAGGARLEIVVQDNGIGFEEKYLDRIFNVFQRLHSRAAYEGTGIGLAVCRKIAERHGGTITARSEPGSGSRFIVTLPMRHLPVKDPEENHAQ